MVITTPRLEIHHHAPHPRIGAHAEIIIPYAKSATVTADDSPDSRALRPHVRGYTSSQPLLDLGDILVLPTYQDGRATPFIGEAPPSYPWAPKFLPEQLVYTDGYDMTGHPLLGAAVVHIPTSTAIYIDVEGT